jgi:predicted RNA-binding Zn-ribbon protein involved in translation (DUF1610 family)
MKETTACRGEYLVIDCPYCGEVIYLNIEDDYGEGEIPDKGRRLKCPTCGKMMLVTECYA